MGIFSHAARCGCRVAFVACLSRDLPTDGFCYIRSSMAASSSAASYQDPQQICDYVLLRHASVAKDAESDKIYKVQS